MIGKKCILGALALWLVLLVAGLVMLCTRQDAPAEEICQIEPETQVSVLTEETIPEETIPEETKPTAQAVTIPEESTLPPAAQAPTEAAYLPQIPATVPVPDPAPAPTQTKEPPRQEIPAELPEETTQPEHIPASFLPCSTRGKSAGALQYWLYIPSDPKSTMPLVVYLHGGSGKGGDLNQITAADGFPQYLQSGLLTDLQAYVIIPQLSADQRGWEGIYSQLYSLIQDVIGQYDLDPSSISLTGHSMGGTGVWGFAAAYPGLFARIAPLSGSVRDPEDIAEKLGSTPVWAFVGSEDTIVPPEASQAVVSLLQASGGQARITVLEGADHFSVPSLAYLDSQWGLIPWLTGQNG